MSQVNSNEHNVAQLSWVSFPLKDDFPGSLLLIPFFLFAGVMAWTIFYSVIFSFIAILLLFSALFKYFFPTRYTLDKNGLKIEFLGCSRTHEWTKFKNFYVHKDGVHLSPFPKPSGLDPFRGIYLRKKTNVLELKVFLSQVIQFDSSTL